MQWLMNWKENVLRLSFVYFKVFLNPVEKNSEYVLTEDCIRSFIESFFGKIPRNIADALKETAEVY